ncbi:DUF4242 domain-containing protein [Acuticoccus sediminis]|uniref:DUF4242 domain-containing protein n=1 Tax=Acuticoccus sediminis TaxID=2184697 RepID=A0A8B2NP43_9HYPH|nr:DUF4242 domain-containing protein [Acuticoccus sediminis]RAH97422.1 DUF4242 domain-containing protein [Acuticoccus sediminis]
MELYVIRRAGAWPDLPELARAAETSTRVGNEMAGDVRWIRSYVVREPDGRVGTVCIYEATGPDAIREHARRVGMPASEIFPVLDTVVVRDDPQRAQAAE